MTSLKFLISSLLGLKYVSGWVGLRSLLKYFVFFVEKALYRNMCTVCMCSNGILPKLKSLCFGFM